MEERDQHDGDGRATASATGASAAAKSGIGNAESEPMIMFCGLPVMVATLPALEAMARASR